MGENESGQMVSEKVNEHTLMYICHKHCEIMQQIQRNSSNDQFHCFDYAAEKTYFDETRETKTAFSRILPQGGIPKTKTGKSAS